jgi:hypothetical protein
MQNRDSQFTIPPLLGSFVAVKRCAINFYNDRDLPASPRNQ